MNNGILGQKYVLKVQDIQLYFTLTETC